MTTDPVTPTTYRDVCGTFDGLRAHQAHGEPACSACIAEESRQLLDAKLLREIVHFRPTPPPPAPISEAQAALNLEMLNQAMERKDVQPCGTHAAYNRHLSNGEKPCEDCRVAQRQYEKDLRLVHRRLTAARKNAA
ncbi:hypothetical protein [Nonomuraea sp. NPDC003214]